MENTPNTPQEGVAPTPDQPKNRIYTHGGVAHADEIMACALLTLKKGEAEILRINNYRDLPESPKDNEYIVDVGEKYDGKQYFDHHQREEEVRDDCAATLVAKTFYPEMKDHPVLGPVLNRINVQDNGGPGRVARELGVEMRDISPFMFFESGLKHQFAENPETVTNMVAAMVKQVLDFDEEVASATEWLMENFTVEVVNGVRVLVNTVNPYTADLPFGQDALNAAKTAIVEAEGVHVDYTFSARDNGQSRELYRYNNATDLLDFNNSNPSSPGFCHRNGFILKFKPADENEWKRLIEEASAK